MIKDKRIWEKFEQNLAKSNVPNFLRNLEDIEEMYKYAKEMGRIDTAFKKEDIEHIINIAKVVNSV